MKQSAGILLFRIASGTVEVLLAHPGGPFWHRRDAGAWSIPKGEYEEDEDAETAARREFMEETGFLPAGALVPLGTAVQNRQKRLTAFACKGDFDPAKLKSNHWNSELPPRSGRIASFPEVDRVEWFALPAAMRKIVSGQRVFLKRFDAAFKS